MKFQTTIPKKGIFAFSSLLIQDGRQIKTIVVSDQNLVKERYMKVKLSQFRENWKNFRNQGIINLS